MHRAPALLLAVALSLGLGLGLSGCSDDSAKSQGQSAQQVVDAARKTLDETSGVRLTLSTPDLPSGVTGIKRAEGVAVHPAAFDGSITVVLAGNDFEVPVISVDDHVYAQIPLTPGWSDIDPTDYGAPDPAALFTPGQGFSALLDATTGLEAGKSVRGGEDNREVLTTYTGSVAAETVRQVIPSASGDFKATYAITDSDELRKADLTGSFYPGSGPMTYTIAFDDYGTSKEISAP